jgi:hypothetical protein
MRRFNPGRGAEEALNNVVAMTSARFKASELELLDISCH